MSPRKVSVLLDGAGRRSIGRADEVAGLVLKQPKLFRELIRCLWHDDSLIRMRAADAAEKVSAQKPQLLARYKSQLLGLLAETTQIELRWHLAQMVPRLKLTPRERQRAAASFRRYLEDRSSIVRTWRSTRSRNFLKMARRSAPKRGNSSKKPSAPAPPRCVFAPANC